MSNEVKSLGELGAAVSGDEAAGANLASDGASPAGEGDNFASSAPLPREPKRDELGRAYATGKRKDAVARVWVKPGSGTVRVNGKPMNEYFARPVLQMVIGQPLSVAGVNGEFDVMCTVKGGGLSGQAGAIKHGISRALVFFDPVHRAALKASGFLTRDSRVVERKKYGRRKARRSFQFSKR